MTGVTCRWPAPPPPQCSALCGRPFPRCGCRCGPRHCCCRTSLPTHCAPNRSPLCSSCRQVRVFVFPSSSLSPSLFLSFCHSVYSVILCILSFCVFCVFCHSVILSFFYHSVILSFYLCLCVLILWRVVCGPDACACEWGNVWCGVLWCGVSVPCSMVCLCRTGGSSRVSHIPLRRIATGTAVCDNSGGAVAAAAGR